MMKGLRLGAIGDGVETAVQENHNLAGTFMQKLGCRSSMSRDVKHGCVFSTRANVK